MRVLRRRQRSECKQGRRGAGSLRFRGDVIGIFAAFRIMSGALKMFLAFFTLNLFQVACNHTQIVPHRGQDGGIGIVD